MTNKERVFEILSDYKPHSTYEIMETLYPSGKAGLFRLAAYVGFLKGDGHDIDGWFDEHDHKKYWYQCTREKGGKIMKWYQHETTAHNDEVMRDLIHTHGLEGYGAYIICLELIGEKIDENRVPEIRIKGTVLREKLRVSHQKVSKILAFFDQKMLIFSNFDGEYWIMKCPNLLKRLDNWTKRSVVTTKQVSLQLQEQRQLQREVEEKNPEPASPGSFSNVKTENLNTPKHTQIVDNPKRVNLADVTLKIDEPAKHKAYNRLIEIFTARGWRTDPDFMKPIFVQISKETSKYEPREFFPYFDKAIQNFINQNSEWISREARKHEKEVCPEVDALIKNVLAGGVA